MLSKVLAYIVGCQANMLGHLCAHSLQCLFDLYAIVGNGFAFIDEFIEQVADDKLILRIGSLQCGNFIVNKRFEFASPSNGS